MSEITRRTAEQLAAAIRAGRLTSFDVVEAYVARIAAVDPQICAYVSVLKDRARAQARDRDADARAGRWRGPLHGVPVAIKDLIAIAGVPMTAGSTFLGAAPQRETAAVVRRLEDAGAVILGTTALNEFALGTTGVNPHGRTPRNPWDPSRITGGSSSGSAAAVAAGLAPAALGTDTGGSIRIPAALCGLVGLKPTFGRVSRRGVLPLAESFDTVGPLVRTVGDAALLLEVIAGPDPDDPACIGTAPGRVRDEMARDPSGLRVGRPIGTFFESDLDPAVAAAMDGVTRDLERAGLPVRTVRLPSAEAAHEAQVVVLRSEAAAFHQRMFPGRMGEYNPDVRAIVQQGASTPASDVAAARDTIHRFRAEVSRALDEYPLLLAPAVPAGAASIADADPHGPHWPEIRRQVSRFTRVFNATGLPTIALPVGLTATGMPVAVQLAAAALEEGRLLAVARRIEAATGWALPELPRSP